MLQDFERAFDSHELYNKWQVFSGMRVSEGGNTPSTYISEVKLRKAFKQFKDQDIEELFDEEMTNKNGSMNFLRLRNARIKLDEKIQKLLTWQLFRAVEILNTENMGAFPAAEYVLMCKESDRQTIV